MAKRTQRPSMLRSTGRAVRYLLFTVIACMFSMAVSYHLVLYMLRNVEPPSAPPDNALVSEAVELRSYSNELLRLTTEFLRQVSQQAEEPTDTFTTWLARDYRPRLNNLRARMQDSIIKRDVLTRLLAASDRVAAMASHPNQENLRELATKDVLDAQAGVQEYITSAGLDRFLDNTAETGQFR